MQDSKQQKITSGKIDLTTKDNKDSKESEDKLQADCYQWFNNTYAHLRGLLYHVPNGEKRDPITANLLKGKGVVAGVPDLVFHFRQKTYFFELKKPNGTGSVSKEQKKIHKQLELQGFIVWLLNDFETFKKLIGFILDNRSQQFKLGLTKADYYYKHKIFNYIYSLEDADVIKINEVCEPENIAKFMNYITEFIADGYDILDECEVLFTPDYKAFYKKKKGSIQKIIY